METYDLVELVRSLPEEGMPIGDVGTVVLVYPGNPPGYEVEFVNSDGTTYALLTLSEGDLKVVNRDYFGIRVLSNNALGRKMEY